MRASIKFLVCMPGRTSTQQPALLIWFAGAASSGPSAQAPGPASSSLVLSVLAVFPPGTQAVAQNLSSLLTSSASAPLQPVSNLGGPFTVSGREMIILLALSRSLSAAQGDRSVCQVGGPLPSR